MLNFRPIHILNYAPVILKAMRLRALGFDLRPKPFLKTALTNAIIDKSAIVNALYKNMRDNPIFQVFYLRNINGWLTNLGHVKGLASNNDFAKPIHFEF